MRIVSRMFVFALLGSMVSILVACGGGSGGSTQKDLCNQTVAASCERAFACGGGAGTVMGFTSVAECSKGMQAAFCASVSCTAGETYQADQAQKCLADTKAQSCTDVNNSVTPPSCDLICSAGGGSGGGTGSGGTGGIGGGTGGSGGGTGGTGGTSGSPAAACTATYNACGGDPTGTWDIVTACIEGNLVSALNAQLATDYSSCGNAFSQASVTLAGSVTYGAGNYSFDATMSISETLAYTPACVSSISPGVVLSASVCDQLQQGLNNQAGSAITCSYATNCNCQGTVTNVNTTSGTYTVSGSTITEDSGSTYQYCVNGNTMTQRELISGSAYGVTQMKKR